MRLAGSVLSLCLLLSSARAACAAPAPDTSGLERTGGQRAPAVTAAPPASLSDVVAEIRRAPDGELARRVPSLAKALAFYGELKPGEDLGSYGKARSTGDQEGIRTVLAAYGMTPERATAEQRAAAAERLANVEYPLRDRAAVTDLLNLWLVCASSEEARGHDASAYWKAYEELRSSVTRGIQAAGGGSELVTDGLEEGELHGAQDLEPAESLVLGFRPAMESVLRTPAARGGGDATAWRDLGERVELARILRERRERLRELALGAAKASAFAAVLAARGDSAGASRSSARATKLEAELGAKLSAPQFAASLRADLADVVSYLRRKALLDPALAGGAGRDLVKRLTVRFPGTLASGPPQPSPADRTAARKEIERLLLLSSHGPYLLLIDFDGLRPDTVEKMLAARGGLGEESLPNLDRYVARRGVFLRNTVTCFPSSTYPGTTTFLTGRYTRFHNIQSNTMFFKEIKAAQDRGNLAAARKKNWVDYLGTSDGAQAARDVPASVPYLFEMLKPCALTFFPTFRGVKPRFAKDKFLMGFGGLFFEHEGGYVPFGDKGFDDLTTQAAYEMLNHGKPLGPDGETFIPARLMTHYFAWIDHASHASILGQASEEVRRFLEYQDRLLGRMMKMIDQLGILDETVIVIISDHGHLAGPAETGDPRAPDKEGNVPFAMSKRLDEAGFHAREPGRVFQEYDAVAISDGEGTSRVYLPKSGTDLWEGRSTFEELKHYVRKRDGATVNMLETVFYVKNSKGQLAVNPAVDLGAMLGRDLPDQGLREYVVYTAKALPGGQPREAAAGSSADGRPLRGAIAIIRRSTQNGQLRYRYLYKKGFEPFGYEATVEAVRNAEGPLEGGWYQTAYFDERDWLAMTMDTIYPDALFGIDNYFSGRDQADVIVSGVSGYCFDETAVDRSDHGYLLAPSMRDTLLIAGRGIRHGEVSLVPHRSVDMIPTALTAIGATDVLARVKLDGRVADEVLEEGFGR